MDGIWPWLAIAGVGALHGLHPANGWMFATAQALHSDRGGRIWRALAPIALGHAAAMLLLAVAFARGWKADPASASRLAGAVLLGLAIHRLHRGHREPNGIAVQRPGAIALALWSALMAAAHGFGMVLVPALVPLCLSSGPWRAFAASGASPLLLAAVALHMAAMLAVTGALAHAGWRGLRHASARGQAACRHLGTFALGIMGTMLILPHGF